MSLKHQIYMMIKCDDPVHFMANVLAFKVARKQMKMKGIKVHPQHGRYLQDLPLVSGQEPNLVADHPEPRGQPVQRQKA